MAKAYGAWLAELQDIEEKEARKRERYRRWVRGGGWPVVEGGGCVGLRNFKNTCWLNSVVQSLAHLEPITAHFLLGEVAAPPPRRAEQLPEGGGNSSAGVAKDRFAGKVMAKGLRDLLREMWQEPRRPGARAIEPLRFHSCLTQNAPSPMIQRAFRTQQDAQEFFLFILSTLRDEFSGIVSPGSSVFGICPMSSKAELAQAADEKSEDASPAPKPPPPPPPPPAESSSSGRNPIEKFFQGQHQSTLTCSRCGFVSKKNDSFLQLSVSVVGDRQPPYRCHSSSLEEALAGEYATVEHLDGNNQWHCERCDCLVDAEKRLRISRLPPVIVLSLKRFAYTMEGRVQKVNVEVRLPDGGLNRIALGRFTAAGHGEEAYSIVSIVNHHGRDAMCGHYTAHCRHPVDGEWYAFNDDRVSRIEASEVWLPQEAYVLCLARQRPTAE